MKNDSLERIDLARVWFSPKEMELQDFFGEVRNQQLQLGADTVGPTMISRGACVKWRSPETDEEYASRLNWLKEHSKRTEAWERETYEKLKAKYG